MQEKMHIALVSTKDNKIIGLITLEDIIEELVGEIEDEFDRLPTYIHPYGESWIMGGAVPMSMVAQTTGVLVHLDPSGNHQLRLADWCQRKHASPLKGGEIIEGDGLQVIVRKLRRKKLSEAIVSVNKK